MLNDFQENYYKQDKGLKSFDVMDIQSNQPQSIIKASIKEFDRDITDRKAFPQSSSGGQVFNNYDKSNNKAIKQESNPYDYIFGFKSLEPVEKPNPSYYRYNMSSLGSDFDIAMDRAEIQHKQNDGSVDNTRLGKGLSGNEFYELHKQQQQAKAQGMKAYTRHYNSEKPGQRVPIAEAGSKMYDTLQSSNVPEETKSQLRELPKRAAVQQSIKVNSASLRKVAQEETKDHAYNFITPKKADARHPNALSIQMDKLLQERNKKEMEEQMEAPLRRIRARERFQELGRKAIQRQRINDASEELGKQKDINENITKFRDLGKKALQMKRQDDAFKELRKHVSIDANRRQFKDLAKKATTKMNNYMEEEENYQDAKEALERKAESVKLPPEPPTKEFTKEDYIKELIAKQAQIKLEIEKETKEIKAYDDAINVIGELKNSHKQMTTKMRNDINAKLKSLSGDTVNIGAIQYTDSAYKRIQAVSEKAREAKAKLEAKNKEIEAERKAPRPRSAPAKMARVATLRDDIPEEEDRGSRQLKEGIGNMGKSVLKKSFRGFGGGEHK